MSEFLDKVFPNPIYSEDAPEVEVLLSKYFLRDPIGNRADPLQDRLLTLHLFGDAYIVEYIDQD